MDLNWGKGNLDLILEKISHSKDIKNNRSY